MTQTFAGNLSFRKCAWVLLLWTTSLASSGCSPQRRGSGDEPSQRVSVQLNWYAEAEHGGVYQAHADGTYQAAGFTVDIRPGGRATPVAAELVMGRADFAITNADDVVLFREQGADIVAVMTAMQNHPRCILVREDSGVKSFDDLSGMTLQRQEGRGFVEFLRRAGKLDGVREVPYHGSVSSLVADPKIAIQAYSFAEPYLARGEGVQVRTLMLSDLGWNPYSSVLVTRGELIRKQPGLVRRFVAATRKGWQNYLTDPAAGNAAILAANQHGMTAEALQFGADELVALAMPQPLTLEDVGMMSAERWQQLVTQMQEIELIKPGTVRAEDCFTLQFLDTGTAEPSSGEQTQPSGNKQARISGSELGQASGGGLIHEL
jgi:NitT/TauT family transport system substrate-binding protein